MPLATRHRRYALRRALVKLADAHADSGGTGALSLEAGQAAAALAESGDGEGLALILRADPVAEPAAWTVACYEIGHLTPSALRDLSDPCEAVNLVGACSESSHVAAELVVSTATGLHWTVLVRVGSALRLMLPSPISAPGREEDPGETASSAHRRWREELDRWSVEPEPSEMAESELTRSLDVTPAVSAALERAAVLHAAELEAVAIRHAAEMEAVAIRRRAESRADLEARFAGVLEAIDSRLRRIEDLVCATHPDTTSRSPTAICRTPN
jgi:hypothetical protein